MWGNQNLKSNPFENLYQNNCKINCFYIGIFAKNNPTIDSNYKSKSHIQSNSKPP